MNPTVAEIEAAHAVLEYLRAEFYARDEAARAVLIVKAQSLLRVAISRRTPVKAKV